MRRIILLWFCSCAILAASPLRISEFSAGGRQGLTDEDGDSPDWIELENISENAIDLAGWSLSDDATRPKHWSFPSTNIAPGGFLIVFASDKNRALASRPLHTNFKLKAETGWIVLIGPSGEKSAITNYPPQVPGISFGLGHGIDSATYLQHQSPGASNGAPISFGPLVYSLRREPSSLVAGDSVDVFARIGSTQRHVGTVSLNYRVMFGLEVEMPMLDDGKGPDAKAGDGTYSGRIPANVAKAGEIVRYFVTARDAEGHESRWPLFADRNGYSRYEGFMVPGAAVDSKLPIYYLFSERVARQTLIEDNIVLVHGDELYDNVQIRERGQITRGFPKPGYNLDFPYDRRFRYHTNAPRVNDLKLLANFPDKSKIRNTLSYEMIAAAGCVGHFAFPVRLQKNGGFFCIAEAVEDGDERWLERVRLDPQGALYKMYGNLHDIFEAEKKTRKHEGPRDLAVLADAMAEHRPLGQRVASAMDHLNIPQCISYLVAMSIISSGDHGHKNYYLYRDTRGTGEWALLPWDVDLSWGHNWTKTYFDERIYFDNPLSLYRAGLKDRGRNPLYNVFMEHPPFRQMYLRRLRTVTDELLSLTGPKNISRVEARVRELMDQIDPPSMQRSDADLDSESWPTWGTPRTTREEADRIIHEYLPARREFLLKRATLHGDRVPPAQAADCQIAIAGVAKQAIQLKNPNEFAVDVTKWRITGAGIEHTFRPGTVIAAGATLHVVANVRAFRSAPEFQRGTMFVQGNWRGELKPSGMLQISDGQGRLVARSELKADNQKQHSETLHKAGF